jgi:hypothetical protein
MFTQQHYQFLSSWVRTAALATTDDMIRTLIAVSLADWLGRDNPKFDRDRFLAACRGEK